MRVVVRRAQRKQQQHAWLHVPAALRHKSSPAALAAPGALVMPAVPEAEHADDTPPPGACERALSFAPGADISARLALHLPAQAHGCRTVCACVRAGMSPADTNGSLGPGGRPHAALVVHNEPDELDFVEVRQRPSLLCLSSC